MLSLLGLAISLLPLLTTDKHHVKVNVAQIKETHSQVRTMPQALDHTVVVRFSRALYLTVEEIWLRTVQLGRALLIEPTIMIGLGTQELPRDSLIHF